MNLQVRDLQVGATGGDVRALHAALAQLKFDIPAAESQGALFGQATRDAVIRLQKENGIAATGVVDAATLQALNRLVAARGGTLYTVSGRVYDGMRAGVGGLALRVVDKNAGPDVLLPSPDTCVTGANGEFTVHYSPAAAAKAGKPAPDIQVQVLIGKKVAGLSAVRYNANEQEVVDIILDEAASSGLPSEYESLAAAIGAHYEGPLAQLKEGEGRTDITYLANKTGWDARAVALAAIADGFAIASKIPPIYFYSLFRAGLPANEEVIYGTDPSTLSALWKSAMQQGMIPESSARAIPEVLKQFQVLGAQKLLGNPAIRGTSAFKDILGSVNLNEKQQQSFAELYMAHRTDMPAFWDAVSSSLGKGVAASLKLMGKLAHLTMNNAPLMRAIMDPKSGVAKLTDPLQLVSAGFHQPSRWTKLLTAEVPLPDEIPGGTAKEKQANYADYLAARLRLGYPTASIAEMVKSGTLAVDVPDQVSSFLSEHQGKFELGAQSIEQYIARNKLSVDPAVTSQVKRLQRVQQLTQDDGSMTALLKEGVDSAYQIVHFDRKAFSEKFAGALGGEEAAAQVYGKALQVHGAVLNVAVSYLTAKQGIKLGSAPLDLQSRQFALEAATATAAAQEVIDPTPAGPDPAHASDVIAYATLESLFGSMDFCSCEHCRSILSPAAYLVDLLLFIDKAAGGMENAQAVLLERRPDIQYLPLTCENTNTPLPYIDVVNEILEYYVANTSQPLSLNGYQGHDTGATPTEDLMASPQYVMDAAYQLLLGEFFPPPLPFHQPLAALRLYFGSFGASLETAMERLRKSDALERGANPYGYRDILMERLGFSREEYRLLTDGTLTLKQLYGFDPSVTDADVIASLSNAKGFARRVGLSYDDLVSLLETRFVNPAGDLVPKIERLGVTFGALKALHDGTLSETDFLNLLPTGAGAPDPAEYGGDISAWVKNQDNYDRIMGIITLTDPTGATEGCNFDAFELRYSKPVSGPSDVSTRLAVPEFTRLLRFIRLWRKSGWTMAQTDDAVCALFRTDAAPLGPGDIDTVAKLDAGFLTLLPRLGIVSGLMDGLGLNPDRDLSSLLACFSTIGTHGDGALYRRMFLNPTVLEQDAAFADNGYGEFLTDSAAKLAAHSAVLRGAFNLTGDEFDAIFTALGYDANTALTIGTISALFRRGWLARALKISVRELLLLTYLTGLDPFAPPDLASAPPVGPPIGELVALVQALKERSLKSAVALYLVWNQDLSGKSAPDPAQLTEFARTLRSDFVAIDDEFAATEDPNGDVLRARMTLVYGEATSDAFFALLDDTIVFDTPYTNPTPQLDSALTAIDAGLSYNDFTHRLSHTGVLAAATRDSLKLSPGVTADFKNAVDELYDSGQDSLGSFFGRFPELKPLYDAYVASTDPPEKKRTALLEAFQPLLALLRKQEQAIQRLGVAASLDPASTATLVSPQGTSFPIHAVGQAGSPALDDVLGVGSCGLAAQFYFRDTASGSVDVAVAEAADLDYETASANPLPANSSPGAPISGNWQGYLEGPETGYLNLVVEADAGASVTLSFDASAQPLVQNGSVWRNQNALQLKAGTLYAVDLTVEKVTGTVRVSWETPKRSREIIPARYLYSSSVLSSFSETYVRFMKAASLMTGLSLTADELAHFATDLDYEVASDGWLNALAVSADPTPATAAGLLEPFTALLEYARIKSELGVQDGRLLAVLEDPAGATAQPDSLLYALTLWNSASLSDVLTQFGATAADLGHFDTFRRVYDAFAPIRTLGISASELIAATTNEPDAPAVRAFRSALRARYADADWRDIIQPINDELRMLQRDALVAYILHRMAQDPASEQIDTPDKLFEYFLMDVEMEPCMQTSRIRHALSSVQLFVERCLMNLEPRVSAGSIDAGRWKWMKRYRVWEANREVFLFPENWLEPELRDDKSPIFKEIESHLLQSDITDDSASSALLTYLSRLSDIAKLEACGMFIEERNPGLEDDVVHVVARSSGAHRTYYYRRYELGYWTAWEQIKLDIDDNPVIPVVWNNRLLLFWLKIMKQTPLVQPDAPAANGSDPHLADMTMSAVQADAKSTADANALVTVQAVLYWSEYYNGQWQSPMTSDPDDPVDLQSWAPQGSGAFDRSSLRLLSDEPQAGQLRITVYGYSSAQAFLLYNTHSLPQQGTAPAEVPRTYGRRRAFETTLPTFSVDYGNHIPDTPIQNLSRDVLTEDTAMSAVQPSQFLDDIWDSPFFFQDRRNVFYVTTSEKLVQVPDYGGIGVTPNPGVVERPNIPPLVLQYPPHVKPKYWGDGGPIGPDPGVVDPGPMRQFITEDALIKRGIATTTPVQYGNQQIGPAGAISMDAFTAR